jgi:hypothetical protein
MGAIGWRAAIASAGLYLGDYGREPGEPSTVDGGKPTELADTRIPRPKLGAPHGAVRSVSCPVPPMPIRSSRSV